MKHLLPSLLAVLLLHGCASRTPLVEPAPAQTAPPVIVQPPVKAGDVAPVDTATVTGTPDDAAEASGRPVIYFDFDSAEIRADSRRDLELLARQFLHSAGAARVVLEGHADERGSREYNLALGQKRSEAVLQALSLLGVPRQRLEAISFGEEKPVAEGGGEAAWSLNRRVEVRGVRAGS